MQFATKRGKTSSMDRDGDRIIHLTFGSIHLICRYDLVRSYKSSSTTTMAISSIQVSVLMMMKKSSSLISLQLNVCARVCIHPR